MDYQQLISEFQKALNDEIEFIKQRGGGTEVRAKSGQLDYSRGNYHFYTFFLESPADFPDDTPIEVRHKKFISRGFLVSTEGIKLSVALEQNIGKSIIDAVIALNPYYLLEILRERLDQLQPKNGLGMAAIGLEERKVGDIYDFGEKGDFPPSQEKAIAHSLGSEVAFIWGPPGTGKTYTLGKLAKILYQKGHTIAILSHTNIAIDNAMEQIAQQMKDHPDYQSGKIIRLGTPHIKDLFTRFPQLDIQYWIAIKSRELLSEQVELKDNLEKLEKQCFELQQLEQLILDIERKTDEANLLEKEIAELNSKINSEKESLQSLYSQLLNIKQKEEKYKNASAIRKFLTGYNQNKINESLETTDKEIKNLKNQVDKVQSQLKEKSSQQEQIKTDIGKLENRLIDKKEVTTKTTSDEIKNKITQILQDIEKTKVRIESINHQIALLEQKILREVKVIGTTLTKGYTVEGIYTRRFDTVIVDEASMAPIPALFHDAELASQKIVIVGDFRQLPPIAQADTPSVRKWLKTDVFELSGITKVIDEGKNDSRLTQLTEQRRMHSNISALINNAIYEGRLKDIDKVGKERLIEEKVINSQPFNGKPVSIVDTSLFNPWCGLTSYYSRFNPYEARVALFFAKQALEDGIENTSIITPYRAQSNLFTKMFWDEKLEKSPIIVSSVHRSQGREKDLIIFSLVEGRGAPIGKLTSGTFGSDAMKLINVGITRARSKLVFIGNIRHLLNKLGEQTTLSEILKPAIARYGLIDVQTVFSETFYPQATFYNNFYKDLEENCRENLVIFSPRVSTERVSNLILRLSQLIKKNVQVLVCTPPPSQQMSMFSNSKRKALKLLEEIGVNVYTKLRKSNATLAVIDKSIYWIGTLNILSHENTDEVMGRVKGDNATKELLHLFKVGLIQPQVQFQKKVKDIKYGSCPKCQSPMMVKRGRYGMFLSCPKCTSTMDVDKKVVELVYGKEYLVCDECGASMEVKKAWRKGGQVFLGCSSYPKCRLTRRL